MDGDQRMETRARMGYALALIGAIAFTASTFIPFYSVHYGNNASFTIGVFHPSLYRDFADSASGNLLGLVGVWLLIFGSVAIIALLSLVGLRIGSVRPRPVAFSAAALMWVVVWLGLLLFASAQYTLEAGFWCLLASAIAVAVAGLLVASGSRDRHTERTNSVP